MEKSRPTPEVIDLQMAHRKLIAEYISAIDVASRLPFFVNNKTLLKPREGETTYEKIARKLPSMSTPYCWRPFIQLIVESHIKSKLDELSIVYTQLVLQLPDKRKDAKLRNLLISFSSECKTFSDTLTVWKNSQTIFVGTIPILLGVITSWLGTDNLLELFPKLNDKLLQMLSLRYDVFLNIFGGVTLSVFFLLSLLNSAFEAKRAIFLPHYVVNKKDVAQLNIYVSEDDLFRLIGRKKTAEFAIDVYAAAGGFAIILVILSIIESVIPVILRMTVFFILIAFLINAVYASRHRWN